MNKKQTVAVLEADGYSVRPYPWTPGTLQAESQDAHVVLDFGPPRGRHGCQLTQARLMLNGPILARTGPIRGGDGQRARELVPGVRLREHKLARRLSLLLPGVPVRQTGAASTLFLGGKVCV